MQTDQFACLAEVVMTDSLVVAAERLGVPTDQSAGPETMPGSQLWQRWPRHRLELAHDVLEKIMSLHEDAVVVRHERSNEWRAWVGDWFSEGSFDDVVGALGLHLTDGERASRSHDGLVANLGLRL
jgi:hypothetical protein